MKKIIPTLLFSVLLFMAKSQSCTDCRYLSPVFDSVSKETVYFARGTTADGDTQDLYMDVYTPFGDTVTNRPVVIFSFGGGFVQGSKDDWYVVEVCKHFTRAGYVCVAPDYRLGITAQEIISLQYMRIFFRPMQELRAVVQHLKYDYAEDGNHWNIDTNRIIIGGASAGGITALMVAHCDTPTEISEMGNISALNALGGFYSSSGFHQNYSWQSLATVNIAGALINADWVEPGDRPIISAHGDADAVVPYAYGPLGGGLLGGLFDLQGSYVVDSVARTKGVCSYLYTMEGKDHPSEDLGMPYIYSVVYRLMVRMHAVINNRSYCCPIQADITPGDTLYYTPGNPASTLTAQITADSGSAQLQWCSVPCQYSSTASSISVTPDTALKHILLISYENNCQAGDIHILQDSTYYPSGITNIHNHVSMDVYPQPATNSFMLNADMRELKVKEGTIELFELTGRRVLQQGFQTTNYMLSTPVNTAGLSTGTYLLTVKTEQGIVGARRVAVQK